MSKTVTVAIIAYNEEQMIKISLGQVINWADQIIILNGSPNGPSTDSTSSIISDLSRGRSNIIYKEGKWGTDDWNSNWDRIQRNEYLKYAASDFLFQVDADEFYGYKDLEEISNIINNPANDKITGIYFNNIHYFGDRVHYQPKIGLLDQRFTRLVPEAFYNDNSVILKTKEGRPIYTTGISVRSSSITRHHFGHAVPWQYYKHRIAKFVRRGELQGNIEDIDNWKDTRNINGSDVSKYSGAYPELMQKEIDEDNKFFNTLIME